MKKFFATAAVALTVALCMPAQAAKHWDDMSWWGNTGAKSAPVADSKGRSGYWWWPTEAASNADDGELWGNRGIVYHIYAKAEDKKSPAPAAAPAAPAPAVNKRQAINTKFLFDFDKSILKPEGKTTLNPIIADLKAHAGDTIAISGHTCDIGADQYNMGLGQRRADAVKKYLVDNGIDASRISTVSLGETKPALPNTSSANRAQNRRAELDTTTKD